MPSQAAPHRAAFLLGKSNNAKSSQRSTGIAASTGLGHFEARSRIGTTSRARRSRARDAREGESSMTTARAAIYARYSTDLQNDRSIEDQVALCRAYAERAKLTVIETYADRAQSGSSTINRPGWQKLMRDADTSTFDVIIAEDVDRISRDEADYHGERKRLGFRGIKIHTAHGGEISQIEGSVRAMMSAHYLENLRHKVRRGLAGVIRSGRHAGGRSYGYRLVPGKPGELVIADGGTAAVTACHRRDDDVELKTPLAHLVRQVAYSAPQMWPKAFREGSAPQGAVSRLAPRDFQRPEGERLQPWRLNSQRK
jgi:DNA invertase Pin-like site-specific DNA recombinase